MEILEYQDKVREWTLQCFGDTIATNILERNYRFLEESLELVQAGGITKEEVINLVNHVFQGPLGEINQELGGVMVTLSAFCNARGINLENAAINELNRNYANIEKIREKHKNKKFKIV